MGQTCFKCDCNELNHGSSELDFSVFDTDIVQIAAYNNEGYCRIKDVFGSDREIIEAVTRCAEVAVEVRENDKAAFQDDNDGYEYISVKDVPRFQKSDTEIENNTSSSPNKNPPIDKSSGLNIQPSPKRQSGDKTDIKVSRPSVGLTNITQPDKRSAGLKVKARPASDSGCGRGLSQADKPVIKAVSRSDNCLPRNVKGLTPSESNFKDEKVVPVSAPRPRSSGSITPPLPPRRFHAKKRIYQSDRASKTVSTFSQNSSQNVNVLNIKERPRSGQSFSASVKTRSEQSNPTIVKDASQSKKDSTNTVYWEIGDVPKKDDPMCRNSSSLRKSIEVQNIVAAIDFGTTYSSWGYSLREDFMTDPGDIIVKRWDFGQMTLYKAPTCILLSPDGLRVEGFGYDAERKFVALVKNGRHKDHYFFKRFKLELHRLINKTRGIKRNFDLTDATGKTFPATKVVAHSLRWLKEDLVSQLRNRHSDKFEDDDIHWVLAIPAVWSRTAKQIMREAAKEADINLKQLSLVLEPEACSIVSHHEAGKQLGMNIVKAGAQYVIIDAAGGSIDLMAIETDGNNRPKMIAYTHTGSIGGLNVDFAFEKLFEDILSVKVFDKFVENHRGDYLELMYNFEIAKRSVTMYSSEDVTFSVPLSLIKIYNEKTAKNLNTNRVIKHLNMHFSQNKLICDSAVFKELFKDATAEIVQHISKLLENDKLDSVTAIIMTGGFSESEILQETIREAFPHLDVLVLKDSSLSVLKGAIMCGHLQEL